jgi:hypothetical protein
MTSHNVKYILSQYIEYLIENPLSYPISGLDYSSLYPSLIMAYNLSPEYLILDREYKEEIKNKGYEIHDINFEYKYENYLQEKCVKTIEGWTVRHDESKEKSNFGLYPSILKNLFAQRAEMKKDLFIYKEKKEHIEKYETDYLNNEEYKECIFKLNYSDTKQKALKVFMNTFYGELGNKNSPLFILELAGAITSAGQKNLLLIKDYVERLNHKVYYGDTDSLYISCPESYYLEKNKEYYTDKINKLQYNTDLITITFKAIEDIKVKVNNYLYKDNGTKYLKMSYEEVLYPMVLLAKKKYYGIPHENIPNFKPAEMFIRGLEVKKRGVSEILKIICLDIMWESLDLKNTKTLRDLVIAKIKEIFVTDWKLEDFVQTGLWKPEKQNVTLNEFSQRMAEENKPVPIPGERFNYVIIKKYPYKYDFKGRQIPLKKADKMEYTDVVEKNNYEIDLKYYFDKQLTGQFARLISYDNEFTEYGINPETDEDEIDDDKTLNRCKKYILQLANMHGNNYIDRNKVFKNIYKVVNTKYKEVVKNANISKTESYNKKYKLLFNSTYKNTEDELNLFKMITYNVENYLANAYNFSILSNKVIKKCDDSSMVRLFNGKNISFYKKQQSFLNITFSSKLDSLIKFIIENKLENVIFNVDNVNVINLIQYFRKKFNIDDIVNTDKEIDSFTDIIDENQLDDEMTNFTSYAQIEPLVIKKIYNDYINLISIKKNIILNQHIFNNLYIKKSSSHDYSVKPHGFKF